VAGPFNLNEIRRGRRRGGEEPVQGTKPFDICVVGGAGHVGLPLSIVLASRGKRVLIYDLNRAAWETIKQGKMPFMETGAEPLLRQVLEQGRLEFISDPSEIPGAQVFIVTIGTPVDEFLHPSLKVVTNCVNELLPCLSDDQLIILRSTVFPGVTKYLAKYLNSKGKRPKIAFCPERIVQGNAIEELLTLPQIVAGVTLEAEEEAAALFGLIAPSIVRLRPMEAEFAKLFSNAYRYIHFAVANQFYMIAESAGLDYYRIMKGLTKDYPRAGTIPRAGLAAGPCLFKDTMQLAAFYKNQFSIGNAAMLINEGLPLYIVGQLTQKGSLEDKTIGLLGMAFKAESDDPRCSLSYKLKKLLLYQAKEVLTTDPFVQGDADIRPLEEVLEKSDILILCAPHSAYQHLNLDGKEVVDIWNFWGRRKSAG